MSAAWPTPNDPFTDALAVVMVAPDDTVTSLNPAAERLLGCQAPAVLGGAVTALVPPECRGKLATVFDRVLAGEQAARHEASWEHEGVGEAHIEFTLVGLREPSGRPLGVAALLRDITARHHDEADLSRMHRQHQQLQLVVDRQRIGRSLRDLVIRRLFATSLGLQAVATLVDPPEASRRIGAAINELDAAIAEIRTTIFALERRLPPDLSRS